MDWLGRRRKKAREAIQERAPQWTVTVDGAESKYPTRSAAERDYHTQRCERSKSLRNPFGRAVFAQVHMPEPGNDPSLAELAELGLPVDPRLVDDE